MMESAHPCFRPSRVFVGAGSNLGDRMGNIAEAAHRLQEATGICALRCAPIYETRPVGPAGPDNFFNTVFVLEVCLSPVQLLAVLQEIEIALGRSPAPAGARAGARTGSRTIDLDILLYDDLVFQNDALVVPHPFMHQREFVLRPLCNLDAEQTHPELGQSMRELLAALPPSDQILGVVADTLPTTYAPRT